MMMSMNIKEYSVTAHVTPIQISSPSKAPFHKWLHLQNILPRHDRNHNAGSWGRISIFASLRKMIMMMMRWEHFSQSDLECTHEGIIFVSFIDNCSQGFIITVFITTTWWSPSSSSSQPPPSSSSQSLSPPSSSSSMIKGVKGVGTIRVPIAAPSRQRPACERLWAAPLLHHHRHCRPCHRLHHHHCCPWGEPV